MLEKVGTEFLRQGILGLIVIVLAVAIHALYKDNKELWKQRLEDTKTVLTLQQLRIDDAKAVQHQLLDNNTQCVTALTQAAIAMDASKESTDELRATLQSFEKEIRDIKRS